MSKILILANDYTTVYNFRRELIGRLISENDEVIISLPDDKRNTAFTDMGCKLEIINMTRSGTNPLKEVKLIFDYKKIIKRVMPDIILTYTAKPNIYGSIAAGMCKIPYINNVTGLGITFQSENIVKKIMLFMQKYAYKSSGCVFFQNSANLNYFKEKNIVDSKARLLPGSGVNLKLHSYVPYPDDGDKVKFVFVSRVRRDKGFDELFDAVKRLSDSHDNIEFHIVGWFEDEEYRIKIDRMQKNYPCIYHGSLEQSEVHRVVSECHCLIHPPITRV